MLSHSELVDKGRIWAFKKCGIVITELAALGEEPDVFGCCSGTSMLLEAKATRSDFLSDKNKSFRRNEFQGIGHYRYYITNPGVAKVEEMPANWGLIEVREGRYYTLKKAEYIKDINHPHERRILLSVIRRIGHTRPTGVSIKPYIYTTQNRASLTIDLED